MFVDTNEIGITGSIQPLYLPISIRLQVRDDRTTEGMEKFVLEVISAQLGQILTGETLEVFAVNSLTVTILDDDGKLCTLFLFPILDILFYCTFSNKCWLPR